MTGNLIDRFEFVGPINVSPSAASYLSGNEVFGRYDLTSDLGCSPLHPLPNWSNYDNSIGNDSTHPYNE